MNRFLTSTSRLICIVSFTTQLSVGALQSQKSSIQEGTILPKVGWVKEEKERWDRGGKERGKTSIKDLCQRDHLASPSTCQQPGNQAGL